MSHLSQLTIPSYKYFPTHLMARCGPKQWARLRILQACDRLKIPTDRWPKFPFPELPRPYYHEYRLQDVPAFHPLYETEAEWRKRVDEFLDKHALEFRKTLKDELASGFLQPIKQTRDTTPIDLRYDWAATYLCYRTKYKDMAAKTYGGMTYTEDCIKATVAAITRDAGLRQGK